MRTIGQWLATLGAETRLMDAEYETDTVATFQAEMSQQELDTPVELVYTGSQIVAVARVDGDRLIELDAACLLTPVIPGKSGMRNARAAIKAAMPLSPAFPSGN